MIDHVPPFLIDRTKSVPDFLVDPKLHVIKLAGFPASHHVTSQHFMDVVYQCPESCFWRFRTIQQPLHVQAMSQHVAPRNLTAKSADSLHALSHVSRVIFQTLNQVVSGSH
jgi:hypothetical protein